ncbi:MAG TPA: translocation/assembly module TamB domain-containing protein [Anaeromyxobacter sp.]|nr:translocation/assembly module TamB domain-containing protein [Anaeromyxobacter sp.]
MRALGTSIRLLGWALLGLLALTGVALSGVVLWASSSLGRPVVAAKLVQLADDRVAGRLELGAIELLPGGTIAVRDFAAFDPDNRLVLQVDRLLVSADLTRLRSRVVGFSVTLEGAAVLVDEDEDGRLSIARAFAPARPRPDRARPARRAPWRDPLGGWTLALRRLEVQDAALWWQDAEGRTRVELHDVAATGRARLGPHRARAELSLRGEAFDPAPGPLVLELRAMLDEDRLRVPLLRAGLGATAVNGLADVDLGAREGRAALTRAQVDRAQARSFVAKAPPGDDLTFDAYAEADGRIASAAVRVDPQADAAVAVRLDGPRALGFDVVTRALDPSALHAAAPAGKVTLAARGGLSGAGVAALRGNLDLDLARSTLRGGELGPATAAVRIEPGSWDVRRLSLVAPGVKLEGRGTWRKGGAAAADLTADLGDLARASDNVSALLGRKLPRLGGRARLEADLSGTAAAPSIAATVTAPALSFGATSADGVDARVTATGPFRPGAFTVDGRLARVRAGARVLAQGVALEGSLQPGEDGAPAALRLTGNVPSLGREPVSLDAGGTVAPDRNALRLARLVLAYPGTRYALEAPATLTFAGPRVDRLALASGPRRIAVEGGREPRGTLDARLELVKLDLARLPVGLLPADQGIAGEVTADARATGPAARPVVDATVSIEGAGFRAEQGARLEGTARWHGGERRLSGRVALRRGAGGTVDVTADLPLPLRGRPGETVAATLAAKAVPLPAILALARSEAPVRGALDVTAKLGGTARTPALRLELAVRDGAVRDLDGVGLTAAADVGAAARVEADVTLAGRPSARVEGSLPLSLAALLAAPGRTLRELRDARATADVTFPGLELAALSGRLGVPGGLAGRLTGTAKLQGRPAAPRGTAALTIAGGAFGGLARLGARIDAAARDDAVEARVDADAGGQPLLELVARLGAPPEKLAGRAGLAAAPLLVDATIPGVDLERANGAAEAAVRLGGVVDGRLHAEGTLSRPSVTLDAAGRGVRIAGRPLGTVRLTARAAGDRAAADLELDPPAGGKLYATAAVRAPITIDLRGPALRSAPAEVKVRADAVDLGFLPALAPGTIRSAAGRLDADVVAAGPLAELAPRGTVRLANGRLGLLEYGDWSGIALDASVGAQAIELRNFEARRGDGSLVARAALRGLGTPAAQLDGRVDAKRLTLTRAGTDLGTVTLGVKLSGTYRDRKLDARLDLPEGEIRLTDRLPRDLQSLEGRPDIVVGRKPPPRKAAEPRPAAAAEPTRPLTVTARLVSPGRFMVRRDVPRIALELKADVTYERQAARNYMSGTVEVVRGTVEPLSDRRFEMKRGRVTFTGGPPKAAILDVEAVYANPAATVTVAVNGPLTKPEISLRSQPPLDEQQIAMLIATGQTELRAGGAGASAQESAAQKAGFAVFNTFIRNQLPLPTGDVSFDARAARVGGYIPGTPIFVGYTRRFDARERQGENTDEVRVEYSIDSNWTLEGRWGTQNTGAASLMWSKDY